MDKNTKKRIDFYEKAEKSMESLTQKELSSFLVRVTKSVNRNNVQRNRVISELVRRLNASEKGQVPVPRRSKDARTAFTFFLKHGQPGDTFITSAKDNTVTQQAIYYHVKVTTERVMVINVKDRKTEEATKVTLI